MIPKSRKFPMRTEFLQLRRSAHRLSTPLCTMYYIPTSLPSRLSVVVPKKVSKLAVVRTWLRRLTYDTLWPSLKGTNLDMVVVYKPIKLTKSIELKEQLTSDLTSTISRLPIIHNS